MPTVTIEIEIPEETNDLLQEYLENKDTADLNNVVTLALSMFLVQQATGQVCEKALNHLLTASNY